MDVIQVAQMFGVPVAVAAAMGLAIWRVGIFVGNKIAIPLVERHVAFIDKLERTMDHTAQTMEAINDKLADHGDRLERIEQQVRSEEQ